MSFATSQEILLFLASHPPATVHEMSKSLNLTKADIRYHLYKLIKQKAVVEVKAGGNPLGRGRPAGRFSVAPAALPNNFAEIVEILLSAAPDRQEEFEELGRRLFASFEVPVGQNLIQKLNSLIQVLNARNYEPHWETHRQGPMIILSNCPYRALLHRFPGFCAMDRALLEIGVQKPLVHLQSFLEQNSCRFLVTG